MEAERTVPARVSRLWIAAPFLIVYYWALAHHVLWRDEFNVWGILCVSQSWREMLGRVHYEAHPALWYAICYAASRITHAPWMLKAIQGAIGTGIYLLLALTTPYKKLELALIFAGYYIAFQYTVMCRMYGLEVLFALIYVRCRMRHPERMVRNTLWLGLIANVDVTAGILSTGLLIEYLWERYRFHRGDGTLKLGPFFAAVATYAVLGLVSVATLWPAKDIGWSATGPIFSEFASGEHLGSAFAKWAGLAFFPQTLDPFILWYDPQLWPHGAIVPLVLALLIGCFRRQPRLGAMIAAVALMGCFFSHATGVAGIRHIGVEYLAFMLALWMMRSRGEPVSRLAWVLLGLTVLSTGYEIEAQWGRPYADDDAAAQWIVDHRLENLPLMGTPDANVIGVAERLEKPLWQIECNCFDRVLTFHHRRDSFDRHTDVVPRTALGLKTLGAPSVAFLINRSFTEVETKGLSDRGVSAQLLAKFDRGYIRDEHFWIYRLTR